MPAEGLEPSCARSLLGIPVASPTKGSRALVRLDGSGSRGWFPRRAARLGLLFGRSPAPSSGVVPGTCSDDRSGQFHLLVLVLLGRVALWRGAVVNGPDGKLVRPVRQRGIDAPSR